MRLQPLLPPDCSSPKKGPTIAVSGPPGSGKTTYARRLAEDLGLEYYSAGRIFRELARERGVSLEEMNRIAANDPRIDLEIDMRTLEIGCRGNVVIEGHLVAWVLRGVADVRIYVTAPLDVRVKRIAEREGRNFEEVYRETVIREFMHQQRFLVMYGIDISNLSIFNLVLDTEYLLIDDAYSIIRRTVCNILAAKGYQLEACSRL
ncbi:(d)CMP kinase [Hyperthermus butylicus]|uniref:(d)CMP kinase n=1 Tax=Hyperthermus butylicus TaxID=54248 RepID=UPI003B82EEF9